MNYRNILTAVLLLWATTIYAAQLQATFVDVQGKPVVAVNLVLEGSTRGASSDSEGRLQLKNLPPGYYIFNISCLGYTSLRLEIELQPGDVYKPVVVLETVVLDLQELQVQGKAPDGLDTRSVRPVERISTKELQSFAGGGGVLQALGATCGVDSKPCALCGSAGVGLQGLDPSYTEIQVDGLVLLSGVGSLYGVESIRTEGLASVELTRGSTDPAQSGAAVAGSVNLRSAKIAEVDTLEILFALGDGLRHETGFLLQRRRPLPTRFSMNWSADPQRLDRNKDHLTDAPQQKRLQGKLEQEVNIFGVQWIGSLRALKESRFAGDVDWEELDRGSSSVYGRDIRIRRNEAVLRGTWRDTYQREWKVANALVFHRQDSWYGVTRFDAEQRRALIKLEVSQGGLGGRNRFEAGYTWDQYEDNLQLGAPTDRRDRVPHFSAGHRRQLLKKIELDAGLRLEHHQEQGIVPMLRGALRWQTSEQTSVSFGAGQAFRQVTLFSLDKAVHAGFDGIRLAEKLDPERSLALSAGVNWERISSRISHRVHLGIFATEFRDKAVLAYTEESGIVEYSNAEKAWSRGFLLSHNMVWRGGWGARVDFNGSRVRYLQEGSWREEHMVNRWTAACQLQRLWDPGQLVLRLKWKIFGPQKMPEGRSITVSPVWQVLDLRVDKDFGNWHIGLDLENMLDWTQPDSPFVHSENGPLLDSAMIYGPLIGRRLRVRFRMGF